MRRRHGLNSLFLLLPHGYQHWDGIEPSTAATSAPLRADGDKKFNTNLFRAHSVSGLLNVAGQHRSQFNKKVIYETLNPCVSL
jgi:hypothetical protein